MEQRTEEWFEARMGCVTASRTADVMAKTKSGYSASRANYMAELICERLTAVQTTACRVCLFLRPRRWTLSKLAY